jgi:hypothetical protein
MAAGAALSFADDARRLDQLGPDISQPLDGVSQVDRMVHRLPKTF